MILKIGGMAVISVASSLFVLELVHLAGII